HGDVNARPPASPHAFETLPELVPRDDIRSAQLERPPGRALEVDRPREVLGDVVDPDRLDALAARTDDRRHGRETREADEGRKDPSVPGKDEARPEGDVGDP